MDCIFCKIIAGEIPSPSVYEDDKIIVIRDIEPKAPAHLLFIPKAHIKDSDALNTQNADIVSHIFAKIPQIAKQEGVSGGYRVVNNCGANAGQSVPHIHFHLLGGKMLNMDLG